MTEIPRSFSIAIQSLVACRPAFRALTAPGELDRPAEEEELFGERRFSRVRVADDAEGPALIDFLLLAAVRFEDCGAGACVSAGPAD